MKNALVLFSIFLIAFILWILWGWLSVRNVEQPTFISLSSTREYEIRQYKSLLLAKTTVQGERDEATNEGFRRIAAFIFGENKRQEPVAMTAPVTTQGTTMEKIAMTTPVNTEETGENTYTISFIMPSKYTLETLPLPTNNEVEIEAIPQKTYAALVFSGYTTKTNIDQNEQKLKAALQRDGINQVGTPILSQYNPPWTPWFMRKNEIWIEVEIKS